MVARTLHDELTSIWKACLYHAVAIESIIKAPIMAGSYSWKFRQNIGHDGSTHFSCLFEDDARELTRKLLVEDTSSRDVLTLPEMHVWNSYQGQVLDISTLHIPEYAKQSQNISFEPSMIPPPYFLGKAVHRNERWIYRPDPLATQLARKFAEDVRSKLGVVR